MTVPSAPAAKGQKASFAYVTNMNSNSISAFEVDPNTGTLSPLPGSPIATGSAPEFLAADASEQFLYVANSSSNDVSAFQIDRMTGALTPVPGSRFPAGSVPKGVALATSANLLFVANEGSNDISAFKIDAMTGALAAVAGSPFGGVDSPFGLVVNPAGTFLYANNINKNSVSGFLINSNTGALTNVPGFSFATGQTPIGVVADPNGKFLYVGDHMQDSVSAYSIDPMSGALTRISGSPATSASCSSSCHINPLRLATHPTVRVAYVANVGGNSLSTFGMNNGTLSPISAPVATGQHPFGVALDPKGDFVYVVNKVDDTISGFSVDAVTGAPTLLPNSPFPAGGQAPVGILIVPQQ